MNAQENTDVPEDGQEPGRTLADAAKELGGLLRMRRARERAGRDARLLERLERQAARSRATVDAVDEPGGES